MSFFGKLFKAAGKLAGGVAKAGLSVATRGVSDKIFSALKGRGATKQVANTPDLTEQQRALVEKLKPLAPRTVRTEQVLQTVRARTNEGGSTAARSPKRMPRPYRRPMAEYDEPAPKAPRARKRRSGPRTVPKGGLDLAAISAAWKAQGKPGTWLAFIKANSHMRKA